MGIALFESSWLAALIGIAAASWVAPAPGGGGRRREKFYRTCGRNNKALQKNNQQVSYELYNYELF
jgi:hypothetical protein